MSAATPLFMPVYQYRDLKRGCVVELVRPVADRDLVPAHLERICVPVRVAVHGTSSSPMNPHDADSQVPKAFRQLEEKMSAREIVKEGGFSVNETKEIWNI